MRYQVFDNDRPAQYPNVAVHPSWKRSTFRTFKAAHAYAIKWLGLYGDGATLTLGEPFEYSGCGDNLVIREIPSK